MNLNFEIVRGIPTPIITSDTMTAQYQHQEIESKVHDVMQCAAKHLSVDACGKKFDELYELLAESDEFAEALTALDLDLTNCLECESWMLSALTNPKFDGFKAVYDTLYLIYERPYLQDYDVEESHFEKLCEQLEGRG